MNTKYKKGEIFLSLEMSLICFELKINKTYKLKYLFLHAVDKITLYF